MSAGAPPAPPSPPPYAPMSLEAYIRESAVRDPAKATELWLLNAIANRMQGATVALAFLSAGLIIVIVLLVMILARL